MTMRFPRMSLKILKGFVFLPFQKRDVKLIRLVLYPEFHGKHYQRSGNIMIYSHIMLSYSSISCIS
jgi:hypothetical protein